MALFSNDEEKQEYDNEEQESPIVKYLFFILILPAFIIGIGLYFLLRFKKIHPKRIYKVSAVIGGAGVVGLLLYFLVFDGVNRILDAANNFTNVGNLLLTLSVPIVLLCMPIGAIMGSVMVYSTMRKIELNPHLTKLEGSWMYNLTFKDTREDENKRKKIIKKLQDGSYIDEEKAPIGLHEERNLPAFRYQSEANKHTLIVGASGSGKSITMLNFILRDIMIGMPVVLIDMKADPEIAAKLAAWTKEAGGNFYHFYNSTPEEYNIPNSDGLSYYDPFKNGSATSRSDMLLNMREYDAASAHYRSGMMQLLQLFVPLVDHVMRDKDKMRQCRNINWSGGWMRILSSAANPANIESMVAVSQDSKRSDDFNALNLSLMEKRDNSLKHALTELAGQLRTITSSEYGDWLRVVKEEGERDRTIDLYRMTREPGNVVLFSINSDSEPDFAKFVTSLIMGDLTVTSAMRREKEIKNPVGLYIDEFQTINPISVKSMLEKSRASGFNITLAQQSFEQIASLGSNGPALLNSILDTCSNFISHAGMTEDSALRLSKILGKHEVTVYRTVGKSRKKKSLFADDTDDKNIQTDTTKEYKMPPEAFMGLTSPDANNNYRSTAVLVNKTTSDPEYYEGKGATGRMLWMIPNSKVLEKYYHVADAEETVGVETYDPDDFEDLEFEELPHKSSFPFILDGNIEAESIAKQYLAVLNQNEKYRSRSNSVKFEMIKRQMLKRNKITSDEVEEAERNHNDVKTKEKNSGYSVNVKPAVNNRKDDFDSLLMTTGAESTQVSNSSNDEFDDVNITNFNTDMNVVEKLKKPAKSRYDDSVSETEKLSSVKTERKDVKKVNVKRSATDRFGNDEPDGYSSEDFDLPEF